MRLISGLTILVLALAVAPHADAANTWLQPGTQINTAGGGCTLNFVFKDEHHTYIGTAGHCAEAVGERMSTPGHGTWGTVVVDIDMPTDFALIQVDASKPALVRPDVQHWGGPTGVTSPAETNVGDLLAIYGYGDVYSTTEPTRAKQGMLVSDDAQEYAANTWAFFGDSGGPILHKDSGKALGVVSRFNLPFSSDGGPTVEHVLRELESRGYNVEIQTAPVTGALA